MDDSVSVLKFAEARAAEIKTLMDDVTSKEGKLALQRLPYHMRRRAASHNPKRLPRTLRAKKLEENTAKPKKKRKTHKKLLEEYNDRQKPGALWLPTHIWFAKRFHMKNMFGYKLPVEATGKRFRSSYKATVKSTLVQDLSYFCCIELRGQQGNLLSHLLLLTDDSLGVNFGAESVVDGTREGTCFLYQPHSFPYHAIGPVSFLWNPSCSLSSVDFNIHNKSHRQLWIWCHPAILEELTSVLAEIFNLKLQPDNRENALKKQYDFASKTNCMKTKLHFQKEPVYYGNDVTMIVLKDTLIRQRLTGPNALPVLTSIMKHNKSYYNLVESPKEKVEVPGGNMEETFSQNMPENAIEDLLVLKQKVWCYLSERKSSYYVPLKIVIGLNVDDPRIYVTPKESNVCHRDIGDSDYISLSVECSNPIISFSEIWNQDVRNKVTASQIPEHVINSERSKYVIPSASDLKKCTSTVPVIIIHQPAVNGYGASWDVIAPQGWGMAFWIPFLYHGAQPAGFGDYCSINLESGCATFPVSFPDTKAGAAMEESTRKSNLKQFYKYSRAKRPNFKVLGLVNPFFMPWNVLVSDWYAEILDKYKRLPNEPLIEHLFEGPVASEDNKQNVFVLRSRKEILHLRELGSLLAKVCRHPLNESRLKFQNVYQSTIQTLLSRDIYFKSLILVRVKCSFRGVPLQFSGIYLPKEFDLECLKENPKYYGPMESCHSLGEKYLKMPASKRRKILKEEAKIESKQVDQPEIGTIVSSQDYKMVGFVSEGGFSRLGAQGYGLGHCALAGFLVVVDICAKMKMPVTVFVREQHNFQYRPATIEILETLF